MGCNCKANEEIMKLYKKYGSEIKPSFGEKINFRITKFLKTIILAFIILLFFPLMIIFFIVMFVLGKRNFNINNIFSFLLMKNKK